MLAFLMQLSLYGPIVVSIKSFMNFLITDGAGFVGSELGRFLLAREYNVKTLDNLEYGYCDNFENDKALAKTLYKQMCGIVISQSTLMA
jgi:UDP-glucose 4-epimerase